MQQVVIEALPLLNLEEQSDRLRLERKVEKAFYEAGLSLKQLRDRKLYRSTHKTFRDYCLDRFGFSKSAVYYLIGSVEVVDNLQKSPQFVDKMPTAENQCRPLKSLEPEQQIEAWGLAIKVASGKVPTASIVKKVVNQIKGNNRNRTTESKKAQNLKGCSTPKEGLNYTPGLGNEWYVRVDAETWHKLDQYAKKVGTATLGGAIARLLEKHND